MQQARSQPYTTRGPCQPPTACRHVVSGSLSLPAQGCFSPVPHGTRSLSVTRESFSLGGWSPQLHARLLGSGVTQEHHYAKPLAFAYGPLTRSGAPFQGTSAGFARRVRGSYNPAPHEGARFGLAPVRSPLLRRSRLISLPLGY